MLSLSQSCFIHISPIQLILNFVLFQSTHPQCALSQPQSHRNTSTHALHAAFKPIQVLSHPSSLQSTCLTHAVLFPQFLRQPRPAHLSSAPTPPSHRVHAVRAPPAFPASIMSRNTRASLMFPSCFGVCTHTHITTRAPTQRNMTALDVLNMHDPLLMLKCARLACASPANVDQTHKPTLLSPCALITESTLEIIAWQHAWTCPLAVCNQFPVLQFCGFVISSKAPGRMCCFQLSFVSARKTQQTPVSREPAQMFPSTPGPTMTANASCTHPACVPWQHKAPYQVRHIESAPGLHTIETRFAVWRTRTALARPSQKPCLGIQGRLCLTGQLLRLVCCS
jgi:hypothetical protein